MRRGAWFYGAVSDSGTATTPAWYEAGAALVARAAVAVRVGEGRSLDPPAGLRIDASEVDVALGRAAPVAEKGAKAELTKAEQRAVEAREALLRSVMEGEDLFAAVAHNARLDTDETEVLALLCAVETDRRLQKLLAYAQDDVALTRPTLDGLMRLFPRSHAGALTVAEDGRLRRAGFVRVSGGEPWGRRTVEVPASLVWSLLGDQSLDPDLPLGIELLRSPDDADGPHHLLFVVGGDRARRAMTAALDGRAEVFLRATAPADPASWEALVREATISGLGVLLEVGDDLPPDARWWIERADHLTWVVSSAVELPLDHLPRRAWVERHVHDESVEDAEWKTVFADLPRGGHQLSLEQLRLAAIARAGVDDDEAALRRLASGPLERLTRRIRPRRQWDDLVLPDEIETQLREVVARFRHRDVVHGDWGFPAIPSAGLVALFYGPSGTGKTTAAEIIAGELALDVFKIDLSSVVSKYIGETEKNLEAIFDAAAVGDLVLLFDEADALFGKRSEVTDARDRYANMEVAYLLQRLEAYDGLVILTTNLSQNIDPAFLRRIHAAVEFPMPSKDDRVRIWNLSLASAPLEDVDIDALAERFELPGGAIRNAALTAAFVAASDGQAITTRALVHGVRREMQKMGRLVTNADFPE